MDLRIQKSKLLRIKGVCYKEKGNYDQGLNIHMESL